MKILNHLPGGLQDVVYIISGIFVAGFGLKGFLIPNSFLDGGITGISLLIHELFNIPLGILII